MTKEEQRLSTYFSAGQWFAYALIILTGIVLRWAELETRPFHHDESQHAMFGKYFYDFPEIQFYKYDPMMHAPLLYNFFRLVYTTLGNTLWSARAPIALIGTLFLFAPLLFRRFFSSNALLALTAAISLSSSMVYWSRFVIHDYFVLLSMLITLYGAVQARSEQRSFLVLLGITLQFCIKANVFVTLAMIAGYLIYELVINYFARYKDEGSLRRFLDFWKNYLYIYLIAASTLTLALHFGISKLDEGNKLWAALINFSDRYSLFIPLNLIFYAFLFVLFFLSRENKDNYVSRTIKNVLTYKYQFLVGLGTSVLVFCYIFSSGFRNNKGILDGLFRTSIPYWLNQHDIERIKGPFLFNFYMFSWYELGFLIFFIIHLYLFYRSAGRAYKIAGLATLAIALLLSLITLFYISPGEGSQHWRYLEEIGNRKIEDLGAFSDRLMTHFVHFFKLKDCLDVIGLVVLLIHPVILTTCHILRGERILGFWGYWFTASFFTYSFLGEKVPWLSMYPLAAGFIYLTLYFDDYFSRNPVPEQESFKVETIFRKSGIYMLAFALFFVAETIISISGLLTGFEISKFFKFFTLQSLTDTYHAVETGVKDNLLLFILGLLIYFLGYINRYTGLLGRVNLYKFLFVVLSLFSLRGAVLTNFVYGGSETEFISQVHTTKEFHDIALRLKHEILTNIRPDTFKVLGDGDPVWPLTWYMVGANEFKFIATPEERKNFDIIIQTYEEEPKNVPEGFEKRRVTLRGWWVPDYNQMTLKKFLNVGVNHIPWSPSGFTYAWMFINKQKG